MEWFIQAYTKNLTLLEVLTTSKDFWQVDKLSIINIAMTQSALSLKMYYVFSNLYTQSDLLCKIILRMSLN